MYAEKNENEIEALFLVLTMFLDFHVTDTPDTSALYDHTMFQI